MRRTWRFYRFLQHEFDVDQLMIPRDVAAVLKEHADLLKQYRAINAFYGRLTNPLICLPVDALMDAKQDVAALTKQRGASHADSGRLSAVNQPRDGAIRAALSPSAFPPTPI